MPVVTETMTLTVRRWVSPSGARLFLPLNLLSAMGNAPVLTKPRQLPVVLNYNYDYEDTDTATYTLPAGYAPKFTLSPVVINSKFGSYNAHAGLAGDQLLSVGRLRMPRGRYPTEAYAEYADFRRKVAKADRTQLMLIRKEAATPLPEQGFLKK